MLKVRTEQINQLAGAVFIERLATAFLRDVPGFSELAKEERKDFLLRGVLAAGAKRLETEQGIASYVLASWWLGTDFEKQSVALESLLKSTLPEVRRVYAMNEWVHSMIGDPDDLAAADEVLRQGVERTAAWGN